MTSHRTTAQPLTRTVPQLLSVTSAAEVLDCSRGHVYGLIAAGKLRAVGIETKGRPKTRVRADDLADFIDAQTREIGGGRAEVRRS